MGEVSEGGLGQVAAFAVLPLLVLFQQDGSDQAGDAVPVGEDLYDVGAALDLTVVDCWVFFGQCLFCVSGCLC